MAVGFRAGFSHGVTNFNMCKGFQTHKFQFFSNFESPPSPSHPGLKVENLVIFEFGVYRNHSVIKTFKIAYFIFVGVGLMNFSFRLL